MPNEPSSRWTLVVSRQDRGKARVLEVQEDPTKIRPSQLVEVQEIAEWSRRVDAEFRRAERLREAAQAVVRKWDSAWWDPSVIDALRAALAPATNQEGTDGR